MKWENPDFFPDLECLAPIYQQRNQPRLLLWNQTMKHTRKPTPQSAIKTKVQHKYYDLKKHWTKDIEPHLDNRELNDILIHDVHRYTYGLWRKPFTQKNYPWEYGCSDWRDGHRGTTPRYWKYVLHGACHWLVNFNLKLAQLTEPERPWRIIGSEKHSTVFDGSDTILDFNFLAFEIDPKECFELAYDWEYPIGEPKEIGWCPHYSKMKY